MKAFVILALVAVGHGFILSPTYPSLRPLPPGISPEVPVVPPKPELPRPIPPTIHPEVESHVLNFPSDEDPQIRVHVNIKQEQPALTRSLLPPTNGPRPIPEAGPNPIRPEAGPNPIHPEAGPNPIVPEDKPEIGWGLPPLPEILPPGILPEVPAVPAPDAPLTFIYPNAQHQLVKLRVQYNEQPDLSNPILVPGPSPYKIEWVDINNKPAPGFPIIDPIFPEIPGEKPIIPMPPPVIGHKQPMVELFLDIGEQENY